MVYNKNIQEIFLSPDYLLHNINISTCKYLLFLLWVRYSLLDH